MKAYKGFNKDLKCRGYQYEIGGEYTEDSAELCKRGFHACELPHDIFNYYAPAESRFCEVDLDATDEQNSEDSKRVGTRIKIGSEISAADIAKISVKAFFDRMQFAEKIASSNTNNAGDRGAANAGYRGAANAGDCGAANAGNCGAANAGYCGAANAGNYGAANAGDRGAANAGDRGAANAGDRGAANAGYRGAANAGDCGAANAGNYGAANAGYCGAANAGNYGAANAGNCGAANAGYCGAANAGDRGAANAGNCGAANAGNRGAANAGNRGAAVVRDGGKAKVGKGGVAVGLGKEAMASGAIGAVLVLTERDNNYNIINAAAVIVDGEKIKANTYYAMKNGEIVEVQS
ncbi:hypothetical protein CE91St46_13280 [Eubacteriales bacterium]|nr:hypothetical protein CE91St46_13280 [Eubacteriales bacterium]